MTSRPGVGIPSLSEGSRTALVQLLIHGPASRADLSRKLRLSAATLTRTSRALELDHLVVETSGTTEQRLGRPSQMLDVDVDRLHLIGIKLSGGQMDIVRTDMRATVLSERSVALESRETDSVIGEVVAAIHHEMVVDNTVVAVGISMAGPVSPRSEVISISPFLNWENVPLVRRIEEQTGLMTVVENDVRALTAAEHWFGAAAGSTDFALVTIGIGVGCGLVVDDRLIDGTRGGGGQIGHLPVTENGPMCERGHRGCVRSYLSSTFMVRHAREAVGDPSLSWDGLLDLARAENPMARRVLADAGRALGTVVGTVAALTAPSQILISGESAGMVPLIEAEMRSRAGEIEHWTMPPVPVLVVPFTFTEWARGAAVIALQRLLEAAVQRVD